MNLLNTTPIWDPPAGYAELESKLPGITVFGPSKVEDQTPAEQCFTCSRCGATTRYDPGTTSVTCAHCGFIQQIQTDRVGIQAEASEFTFETLQEQARGWGSERRELHCDACGVDISIEANNLSTTCPFCGSNHVVNRLPTQDGLRPSSLIPFRVTPEVCQQNARNWLGTGWMHPSDLKNASETTRFQGIYIPYWIFSAETRSKWEAQVGYERTEQYYDAGAKEWRHRTVIDWRWESGEVSLPVNNLFISGTKNISPVLLEKLKPFQMAELVNYEAKFLAGWQAKSYDIPLQTAWETGKTQMRDMAKQACMEDIPTSHVRNFSMAADFDNENWRLILVPIYFSVYRFQEKSYQILVNGQTGSVTGQKPVAWWKVCLAIVAMLIPGIVLSLIGLPLLALGGTGVIFLILGLITFVVGLVISGLILKTAIQAGDV